MREIIVELEKRGLLKRLVKHGYVSTKLLRHYEIYLEFDKLRVTRKMKTTDIVVELSEQFRVSESTIYRILKTFLKNENWNLDTDTGRP